MTATPSEELTRLRDQIDQVDHDLVEVLARRFALTRSVGELKAAHQLPPKDSIREALKKVDIRSQAQEVGINPDLMQRIYELIVTEVIVEHRAISSGDGALGKY